MKAGERAHNKSTIDPVTGFLESKYNNLDAFSAEKKQLFLDKYAKSPNLSGIANELGVHHTTVYLHINKDPAFKAALDRCRDEVTDRLEARVAEYAERPSHFMDRIAWLRAHRPGRWAPDQKVNVQVDHQWVSSIVDKAKAIDAEEVS